MLDWSAFVRQHLRSMKLDAQREQEIHAELAEFLEDIYQDALDRGLAPDAALSLAQRQVDDWRRLRRKLRSAAREGDMSHTARTLWIPGTSMLVFAFVLLLVMTSVVPPTTWVTNQSSVLFLTDMMAPGESADPPWLDVRPAVILLGIWMSCYMAFGAVGAWWSRRAGGDARTRFLAGVFPVAMHLALFIPPIIVHGIFGDPRFPEFQQIAWLARVTLTWVLIPGFFLAIGTLPFLRRSAEKTAPSGTPRPASA